MNNPMDLMEINQQFEEFYKESPAAIIPLESYTPEQLKNSMHGAYLGGFIAAMERTNARLKEITEKHGH